MTDFSIEENIKDIKYNIDKYKNKDKEVILLAVTKKVSSLNIREAYNIGIRDFGESYVQEALPKINELKDLDIKWHFIGHLQSNKVGKVVENFHMIQTVDSLKLAQRIDVKAREIGKVIDILLQINLSEIDSKFGFKIEDLDFIRGILELSNVRLKGLMTMAPFFFDPEQARPYFTVIRELAEKLNNRFGMDKLNYLSMGMTGDYIIALCEGANIIRIGSGIFGPRNYLPE